LGAIVWALNAVIGPIISVSGVVLFASLFVIGSVLMRMLMLNLLLKLYRIDITVRNVLIYGAGTAGLQLALALRADRSTRVVGFVDDNKALQSVTVAGVPVFPPSTVATVARKNDVRHVLLAMPSIGQPKLARIARKLSDLGLTVQSMPSLSQLLGEKQPLDALRTMLPDDFLSRKSVDGNLRAAYDEYFGRTVLVSGAGGSIGSELCRQVLQCKPSKLVLLDVSEYALYQIYSELSDMLPEDATQIIPLLGSVTDRRSMIAAFAQHDVQIVLHAAAYKHVPLVERNVLAGIFNNVIGTATLAQAAALSGVERFVLVSTDKAVRPVGVMGATKRMAEMIVADWARTARRLATPSQTVFCMVRFGNVLGSSGSVIPRFQEQITMGGPVTLTHPDVTRYFMTIQEATQLVLRAGAMGQGGEVFLLDMGERVRIADLARRMIAAAGYTVRDADNPSGDIEIAVTDLRPGEKLEEQVLITQCRRPTAHPKIFVAEELGLSPVQIAEALGQLRKAVAKGDTAMARKVLMHWIARDLQALKADNLHPDGTIQKEAG